MLPHRSYVCFEKEIDLIMDACGWVVKEIGEREEFEMEE
jgi:hypothetical protein